jgi:5-methylcytosine-specific restriction endonuclease McrA
MPPGALRLEVAMARLRQMAPRVGALPPRVGYLDTTREQARAAINPLRKLHATKRWRDLRDDVLLAAGFACARCGWATTDTSKLVADHVTPHRGDLRLFWDRENLQCLCVPCHSRVKQVEENAARWR